MYGSVPAVPFGAQYAAPQDDACSELCTRRYSGAASRIAVLPVQPVRILLLPGQPHPRLTMRFFKQNMAEAKVRYQPTETEFHVRDARKYRLVPSKRLVARLGLREFDQPAPWTEETITPAEVHIATSQHVGAPAVPVVSTGDRVTAGQLIGKVPDGALGAPIHASVSGTVSACGNDFIVIRMG